MILAIPTLRRFDLLAECVKSALAGTLVPSRIVVIDNSGGNCPPIEGAEIVLGRQPQSVAKAWNDAVRITDPEIFLVIANDDVLFAHNTFVGLICCPIENQLAGIVSSIEGERFAVFWINRQAWQQVGGFDEEFEGAYFEDNDFARRLSLAGWEMPVARTDVKHARSSTIAAYSLAETAAHHKRFQRNRERYVAKWGGLPGEEQFTTPFNK